MILEADLAKLLNEHKKTIAVAESVTGGLISHLLTNIPGSSKYFKVGVVAYSRQAKISLLDVPRRIIAQYGAVSSETALSMAKSIRKIMDSDIGLSATGIAGPSAGLVYIGLAHRKGAFFKQFRFKGAREMIKLKASRAALKMVKEWMIQSEHLSP